MPSAAQRRPVNDTPPQLPVVTTRVTQAALRRAALDYRALLDTNYKQGDGAINLFDIALEKLLADFPVTVAGGTTHTIGELWRAVEQAKPAKHTKTALTKVNQACADFNSGFNQAWSRCIR